MTLIASWVAMDDNKNGKAQASLYLASDSRVTYLVNNNQIIKTDDHKQKLFISNKHPEMFAVCGDYNKCSKCVKNLICQIDDGTIQIENMIIEDKISVLICFLVSSQKKYYLTLL